MKAIRDAGTDRWGMRVIEMQCPDCGYLVTVRKYVAEKGKRCPQCAKRKRSESSYARLGIAPPVDVVSGVSDGSWLVLEHRKGSGKVSLFSADSCDPTRHDAVSRCAFEFPNKDLALSVRAMLGPRPEGDFLTLACRIRDMHAALTGGV